MVSLRPSPSLQWDRKLYGQWQKSILRNCPFDSIKHKNNLKKQALSWIIHSQKSTQTLHKNSKQSFNLDTNNTLITISSYDCVITTAAFKGIGIKNHKIWKSIEIERIVIEVSE